jgi:hypothetical protein
VPPKVSNQLGLLFGRHADKRGEKNDVVLAEHIGQGGHVGGVEVPARAQVLVREEQLLRALVCRAAHVVVVELRVGQVVRGELNGRGPDPTKAMRDGARPGMYWTRSSYSSLIRLM